MNNRYVADVGDFTKFALLRELERQMNRRQSLRLGVAWYRTNDGGGAAGDGRHTGYLTDSAYQAIAPEVVSSLAEVLQNDRSMEGLERSGLLPEGTLFHGEALDAPVGDRHRRLEFRRQWLSDASELLAPAQWLFLDPDNGLATERMHPADRDARKYAFIKEVAALAGGARSVVLYHHIGRTGSMEEQARGLRARLEGALPRHRVRVLRTRRLSVRLYALAAVERDAEAFALATRALTTHGWANHFEEVCA